MEAQSLLLFSAHLLAQEKTYFGLKTDKSLYLNLKCSSGSHSHCQLSWQSNLEVELAPASTAFLSVRNNSLENMTRAFLKTTIACVAVGYDTIVHTHTGASLFTLVFI